MSAVLAHALHRTYGERAALHGVDLDVRAGTVCGLPGPNGAGKPIDGLGRFRFGNDLRPARALLTCEIARFAVWR